MNLPVHIRPAFGASDIQIPEYVLPTLKRRDIKAATLNVLECHGIPRSDRELLLAAQVINEVILRADPDLANHVRSSIAQKSLGIGIVHNLPHEDINVAQIVSLAVSQLHGVPFAYASQGDGKLCTLIEARERAPENSNASPFAFGHHSDDAFILEKFRVQRISLFGLVNELGVRTGFMPVDRLIDHLNREQSILGALLEPRYSFRLPASFNQKTEIWSPPRPVLWKGANGTIGICCSVYATRPFDPADQEAANALARLTAYLEHDTVYFAVEPGTYVVLANNRGLHNREIVDGPRQLLRSYIRDDLKALQSATGSDGNVFDLEPLIRLSTNQDTSP